MSDVDSASGGSMRSRRRRSGSSSALVAFNPPLACSEEPDSITVIPNHSEIEAINFLSSPLRVWQVISSFNSVKRELVQQIGFGGILSLPRITTANKPFTYWLLSRVKWFTTTLSVGDQISLTLNPEHIGKITGLSTCGQVIDEKSITNLDDKCSFITRNLSFLHIENGILEAAEMFVQREFAGSMTTQEKDNFQIAFVIFVVGRFLAPSTEHNDGNTNFWGALEKPSSISSYNWSLYVYSNLKKAARLVNWVTPQKKPLSSVIGCSLILQTFYLDNVDFGDLNLPHDLIPRWSNYSDAHINALIAADRIHSLDGSSTIEYGRTQATREGSTCYIFSREDLLQITAIDQNEIPPTYPLRQRRSSRENSITPDQSDEDTFHHLSTGAALPLANTTRPNFDKEVLDFNAYIANKYQGQVAPQFLEDMKSHNARCLSHLSNSFRSLAHSIVNENAHIASRFLEHRVISPTNIPNVQVNHNFQSRRRSNHELPSGTDSSTDGEDYTMRSKCRRTSTLRVNSRSSNTRNATIAWQGSPEMSITPTSCWNSNTSNLSSAIAINNLTVDPSRHTGHMSLSHTEMETPALAQFSVGEAALCSFEAQKHISADEHSGTQLMDPSSFPLSDFATPEATLKMGIFQKGSNTTFHAKHKSADPIPVRMISSVNGTVLNYDSPSDHSLPNAPKRCLLPGPITPSHFSMKVSYPQVDPRPLDIFFEWLCKTNSDELQSIWVLHNHSRTINIFGEQLKDQFVANHIMTADVFDACIRRLIQIDSSMYSTDDSSRWRQLLESDFALDVLSHGKPYLNKAVREQLVGPDVVHDLSRCQMIYIPVFSNGSWRCYIWDLVSAVVFIIDPSATSRKDDIVISKHVSTMNQLVTSLSSTINELFTGWYPNKLPTRYVLVRIPGMPYSSRVSGLITLFCIWYFDGSIVTIPADKTTIRSFKAYLLNQLLQINLNSAELPSTFIQSSL